MSKDIYVDRPTKRMSEGEAYFWLVFCGGLMVAAAKGVITWLAS